MFRPYISYFCFVTRWLYCKNNKRPTGLNDPLSIRYYISFLSEGFIFAYQQPHHRKIKINNGIGKQYYTITINVLYIDRVEDHAFSLYDLYGHTPAQDPPGFMKLTILIDFFLVIITIFLVCLICALK